MTRSCCGKVLGSHTGERAAKWGDRETISSVISSASGPGNEETKAKGRDPCSKGGWESEGPSHLTRSCCGEVLGSHTGERVGG